VSVLCTKFQLDPSMHSSFIVTFLSVGKDEEERNLNDFSLRRSHLENGWSDLLQIWYVDADISAANLVEFG